MILNGKRTNESKTKYSFINNCSCSYNSNGYSNEYKQITLDSNIPCEEDYGETQISLDKEFENFKNERIEDVGELIEHGNIYRFEFKKGKCVKLIHVVTGVQKIKIVLRFNM